MLISLSLQVLQVDIEGTQARSVRNLQRRLGDVRIHAAKELLVNRPTYSYPFVKTSKCLFWCSDVLGDLRVGYFEHYLFICLFFVVVDMADVFIVSKCVNVSELELEMAIFNHMCDIQYDNFLLYTRSFS